LQVGEVRCRAEDPGLQVTLRQLPGLDRVEHTLDTELLKPVGGPSEVLMRKGSGHAFDPRT
jgi:hypothetical protein